MTTCFPLGMWQTNQARSSALTIVLTAMTNDIFQAEVPRKHLILILINLMKWYSS